MTISSNPNYSYDRIFSKFMELFNFQEMKIIFNEMLPNSELKTLVIDTHTNVDENYKDDFCRNLLELIGDKFFYKIPDGGKEKMQYLRHKLLQQMCKKNNIAEQVIIDQYNKYHESKEDTLRDLCGSQYFADHKQWKYYVTEELLDIPESVIVAGPDQPKEEETTPLQKRSKLKSLHDYQYQSVNKIINMLSNKNESKKAIFINLPTGAGKTRLTVEAIIEFINLKNQDKISDSHDQQKKGKIIFWFASTIELCKQAADEFIYIFDSIGIGTQVYLTRLYDLGRRNLTDIINDYDGIHIVVTNTEHFIEKLNEVFLNNKSQRYLVDKYANDEFFIGLRNNTICIVVDEAHDITSKSYQRFVAAMGFDNSGTKESKTNFSRQNIILIGLSATAYKGSGLETIFECEDDRCNQVYVDPNQLIIHAKKLGHLCTLDNKEDESTPDILKHFNLGTKKIFSMFQNNIYVPLPHEDTTISNPVAIIDMPASCVIGEHFKISALNSFDRSSDIKYRWEIRKTSLDSSLTIREESYFSHSFASAGTYTVKLIVTSLFDKTKSDQKINDIIVYDKGKCFEGTIEDNKKFYDILTSRKILCPVTHGVIIGPKVNLDDNSKQRIKRDGYENNSNSQIMRDVKYNQTILDIVKKSMTEYGRKKVLIFANSVEHAHILSLIIKLNYKRHFNINSAAVSSLTLIGQRRKIIQDYKDGLINVLVNFGVLTTGFDVPKIDTVIISRLVISNSLMTQMIGRGQRGLSSGGTEDLWLFTSRFLDNSNKIQLGWEVTAQNWKSFDKDQQNNLNVITSTTKPSSIFLPNSNSSIPKTQFILDTKKHILQCTQCKRQVIGLEKIKLFFGIPFSDFKSFNDSIETGAFRKNTEDAKCKFCRAQNKIMVNCNCLFTINFSKIHDFKLYNVLIAKTALSELNSNTSATVNINKILDNLQITQNQLPGIQSKLENNLFSFKTDTFTRISEPNKLRQLLNLVESVITTEQTTEQTIHETEFFSVKPIDESQKLFFELETILRHSPTSRQFNKFIEFDESKFNFDYFYNGQFNLLLSELKINIVDDINLQNLLYDNFFDKCIKVGKLISENELNEYGQFGIKEYVEIFGSYANFTSSIQKILNNVLTIKIENNFSIKDVLNDYSNICKLKMTDLVSFSDIFMFSNIGIERYIQKRIPFYLIPLLHNKKDQYSEKDLELFLLLLLQFFKLQNILNSIPTEQVFLRYIDSDAKSFYEDKFSDFHQFLNHIEINFSSDILERQKVRMEKYLIEEINSLNENSKVQLKNILNHVISKLNYNLNNFSKYEIELSIQIDNFIENKNTLNNYL